MVLARCEWGQDDYSLNVANLPMAQRDKTELEAPSPQPSPARRGRKAGESAGATPDVFGNTEGTP